MLTVFFRSLTAATATAIAIVAPIRIISRPVGNHGTTLSTPIDGSCSSVLLPKYEYPMNKHMCFPVEIYVAVTSVVLYVTPSVTMAC